MLASAFIQLGQFPAALDAYQQALNNAPSGIQTWGVQEAMARLYAQAGDSANALLHLQYALNDAPPDQKDRLRSLQAQIQKSSP